MLMKIKFSQYHVSALEIGLLISLGVKPLYSPRIPSSYITVNFVHYFSLTFQIAPNTCIIVVFCVVAICILVLTKSCGCVAIVAIVAATAPAIKFTIVPGLESFGVK